MPRKKRAPSPLEQRKKPTQTRSETTVEAIVEAAAHIFERGGRGAYNTNAIAERAGVSIGSLYQYFASKEAITRALIDRETAILMLKIRELRSGGSPKKRLERLVQVAVTHQFHRAELSSSLDAEEATLAPSDKVRRAASEVLSYVEDCLVEMEINEETCRAYARDMLSLVRVLVDAAGQRGEHDHDAVVQRTWGAVCGFVDQLN